jgi:RimJ/RimL family protein N-acetyltransferase
VISLCPLHRAQAHLVAEISLRPDQLRFAGTVQEALDEPAERFDLHMIVYRQKPVGLFKIDRQYPLDYPFSTKGDLGLRAVILDHRVQGKGIGKAAMGELSAYLPEHYPDANTLWLTVNQVNPVAIATYLAAGFIDTGAIWPHGSAGPQHIMRLALR